MSNQKQRSLDFISVADSQEAIVKKVQLSWDVDRVGSGEIPIVIVGAMLSYNQRLNGLLQIAQYSAFEVSTIIRAHMSAAKRNYLSNHLRDKDFIEQTDLIFSWTLGRNLEGCTTAFRFNLEGDVKRPRHSKRQFNESSANQSLINDGGSHVN